MSFAHLSMLLANRQAHLEKVPVRYTDLERAVAEFTALCDRICTCEQQPKFDLVAHVSIPSREEGNPLASAAAVQMRKDAL